MAEISIKDINRFRIINQLKKIYRLNSVNGRKESAAEHSWSALVLADFLIGRFNLKLNRTRVYELLIYHDLVEIEAGDIPLNHEDRRINKSEMEMKAAERLMKKLPGDMGKRFIALFREFEEQKSVEAGFARAVDALDAVIHEIDHKEDWKGWTKRFLMDKKMELFNEFPEMRRIFIELVEHLDGLGYFEFE